MHDDSTTSQGSLPGVSRCPACGRPLGELRLRTCPHCGAALDDDVWEVYRPPRGPVFRAIAVLIIALVVVGSVAMLALTLSSQCAEGPSRRSAGISGRR